MGDTKKKKFNFSSEEREVIVSQVEKCRGTIFKKLSNTITNLEKQKVWQNIATKVNAVGRSERTSKEVKKKWHDMASQTKKKEATRRREMKKTGGGVGDYDQLTPTEEKIVAVIGDDAIDGVKGGVDIGLPPRKPPCRPLQEEDFNESTDDDDDDVAVSISDGNAALIDFNIPGTPAENKTAGDKGEDDPMNTSNHMSVESSYQSQPTVNAGSRPVSTASKDLKDRPTGKFKSTGKRKSQNTANAEHILKDQLKYMRVIADNLNTRNKIEEEKVELLKMLVQKSTNVNAHPDTYEEEINDSLASKNVAHSVTYEEEINDSLANKNVTVATESGPSETGHSRSVWDDVTLTFCEL